MFRYIKRIRAQSCNWVHMGEPLPLWTVLLWSFIDHIHSWRAHRLVHLEEHVPRRPAVKHVNVQPVFLCCHHVIINGINEKKSWKKQSHMSQA